MGDEVDARGAALGILSTPRADTRFGASYLPRQVAEAVSCRPTQAVEALWGLLGEGLVYLDPSGQGQDNWRWLLSETGRRSAGGGSWEPREPAGYLKRLRKETPDLDEAALAYLIEALRAFNAGCFLASSVMLGVAAERVFNQLADAFVKSRSAGNSSLRRIVDPRVNYVERFRELRKRLEPIRPNLPAPLGDVLTLDAVGDLLRVTRNQAGHPTGEAVDGDTARIHLQMGAVYLRKMTELAKHFTSGR